MEQIWHEVDASGFGRVYEQHIRFKLMALGSEE
jgi:hypothetical protein